jgi:hypothetical protein
MLSLHGVQASRAGELTLETCVTCITYCMGSSIKGNSLLQCPATLEAVLEDGNRTEATQPLVKQLSDHLLGVI